MITFESAIRVLSSQLIEILIPLVGAFSSMFSRVFVRDRTSFHRHRPFVEYVLTGQANLVAPLSGLLSVLSYWSVRGTFNSFHVLFVAVCLLLYILLFVYYLQMGPLGFHSRGMLIQIVYRLGPVLVSLLALIPQILATSP